MSKQPPNTTPSDSSGKDDNDFDPAWLSDDDNEIRLDDEDDNSQEHVVGHERRGSVLDGSSKDLMSGSDLKLQDESLDELIQAVDPSDGSGDIPSKGFAIDESGEAVIDDSAARFQRRGASNDAVEDGISALTSFDATSGVTGAEESGVLSFKDEEGFSEVPVPMLRSAPKPEKTPAPAPTLSDTTPQFTLEDPESEVTTPFPVAPIVAAPVAAKEAEPAAKSKKKVAAPPPKAEKKSGGKMSLVVTLLMSVVSLGAGAGGVFAYLQPQLADRDAELTKTLAELTSARSKLITSEQQAKEIGDKFSAGEMQLAAGQGELTKAQRALKQAQADATKALDAAKLEVTEAVSMLDKAKLELTEATTLVETSKTELADSKILLAKSEKDTVAAQKELLGTKATLAQEATTVRGLATTLAKSGAGSELDQSIQRLTTTLAESGLSESAQVDLRFDLADLLRLKANQTTDAQLRATALAESDKLLNEAEKLLTATPEPAKPDADQQCGQDAAPADDAQPAATQAPATVAPIDAAGRATALIRLQLQRAQSAEQKGDLVAAIAAYEAGLKIAAPKSVAQTRFEIGLWRSKLDLALSDTAALPAPSDAQKWLDEVRVIATREAASEYSAVAKLNVSQSVLVLGLSTQVATPKDTAALSTLFMQAERSAMDGLYAASQLNSSDLAATLDRKLSNRFFALYQRATGLFNKLPADDFRTLARDAGQGLELWNSHAKKLAASVGFKPEIPSANNAWLTAKPEMEQWTADLSTHLQGIQTAANTAATLKTERDQWKTAEESWSQVGAKIAKAIEYEAKLEAQDQRWTKDSTDGTKKWLTSLALEAAKVADHDRATTTSLAAWDQLGEQLSQTLSGPQRPTDAAQHSAWRDSIGNAAKAEVALRKTTQSTLKDVSFGEQSLINLAQVVGKGSGFEKEPPASAARWASDRSQTEEWLTEWKASVDLRFAKPLLYKQPYGWVGGRLFDQKDYAGAEAVFTTMIIREPSEALAYGNRGVIYLAQGKLPPAIEDLKMALAKRPDDASLHFALAWAFAKVGNQEKSQTHYDRAVSLDPLWRTRPTPLKLFHDGAKTDITAEAKVIHALLAAVKP